MAKSLEDWQKDPLVEKVARVAYAAIREWCLITSQPIAGPWGQLSNAHHGHVNKVIAKCFYDLKVPSGKELHETCLTDGIASGWVYGDYNPAARVHPDILPWNKLSTDQRMKDIIMSNIIKAFLEG